RRRAKHAQRAAAIHLSEALDEAPKIAKFMQHVNGLAVLSAAQHLLCDFALTGGAPDAGSFAGRACEIAFGALDQESAGVAQSRHLLLNMFERCYALSETFGVENPEITYTLANLARQTGDPERAIDLLKTLRLDTVPLSLRARALVLKADAQKDLLQAAGKS